MASLKEQLQQSAQTVNNPTFLSSFSKSRSVTPPESSSMLSSTNPILFYGAVAFGIIFCGLMIATMLKYLCTRTETRNQGLPAPNLSSSALNFNNFDDDLDQFATPSRSKLFSRTGKTTLQKRATAARTKKSQENELPKKPPEPIVRDLAAATPYTRNKLRNTVSRTSVYSPGHGF